MKNKRTIDRDNLPVKFPVGSTLLAFLALDHWNADQWLWGAVGLLFLIIWIYAITRIVTDDSIDVLKDK